MNLGRHHPLLARVRSLRRSAAARAAERTFVAEGIHLAAEALAADQDIEFAIVDARLSSSAEGLALAAALANAGVSCHDVARTVMDGLQDARCPQPVLLVISAARLEGRPWRTRANPLVVVCDGIQDPGNLGTLLRSADAAGAAALIVAGNGADLTHPRTVRASTGSLFRLPTERRELEDAATTLRNAGLQTVGTVARGGQDYRDVDWTSGLALFFGNEARGLPEAFLDTLDRRVSIPLHPGVESLSVGAAVAVTLFEAARQRRR
jgi:TrmH family RNA methyltransferase